MFILLLISALYWYGGDFFKNAGFMTYLAVGLTVLLVALYEFFKWRFRYWKRKNVPYIKPSVPFGNFENLFKRTMHSGDKIAQLYKDAKKKGWKHCGVYSLTTPNYMVIDLEMVKNVMTKDFQYFVDRRMYVNEKDDPLSAHLFSLAGKKWRNLRTKLTPAFTTGKLKGMFQTLVDCGTILEKYFEENINNTEPVDIKDVLGRFSTDIIGSCAFGIDCNSFEEPNSPFREYGKQAFTFKKTDIFKFIICLNFPKLARALHLTVTPAPVSNFFYNLAQDTVQYREKNKVVRNDFMQLLMSMKRNNENKSVDQDEGTTLTMDEIAAQCFIFFIAGFETSSTTMTFALFELATHPDIQDKVREEIESVLEKHDDKITYDSLSELKYMSQVIDEVLRMYPPVSFLTRQCVKDYKLPGEDVVIEKGTGVFIPVKGIHYDEEYYEEPEKFDPERFTEERKRERNRYAHMPFGEGPRICIGERFGIMQTKVGLTSILRRFRVKLNKRTKMPLKIEIRSFITSAEGSIWLDIERI